MSEWQTIDTAPIWKMVIVYDKKSNRQKSCGFVFCAVQVEKGIWDLSTKSGDINPTHWMKLPEAPK